MGTGYVRNDTANNIADGNVINASDLDGEFDAIQAAFNASTGHSHDGTTGEGPQIGTAGIANDAVTLGTKTNGNYVAAGATSGNGISGSVASEGGTFTVTSNATNANTGSTIVFRDASGNFSAGTVTAALSGNATTATTLQTARTINGVSFNGSANITVTANTPNTLTRGSYLTGSNFNGSAATTWAVDATSANTASKVVARDASGNFSAGTVTAALSGNASTATTLQTARTIALSGDVTGSASFNGSANVTITATVADDSHNHSSSSGNFTINGTGFAEKLLIDTNMSVTKGSGTNSENTGVGVNALTLNSTGTKLTAIGYATVDVNTTGYENTGIGHSALTANTTGYENTAVGYLSLGGNTTGFQNVAVGVASGTGTNNQKCIFIGNGAGAGGDSGSSVMIGHFAGRFYNSNSSVFIGTECMGGTAFTTGSANNGIGYRVLYNLTSGSSNVAMGREAMYYTTTGYANTCLGHFAGQDISTGYQNICVGSSAAQNINTGYRNTVIGTNAGTSLTSGNTNILIGYDAECTSGTAVGQCTLGDASITNLRCNDTTISSLSDARDKTDIVDSPFGLQFLSTIRPRQFKWQSRDGNGKDGWTRLGFIAQELLEATNGQNNILDLVLDDNPEKLEAKMGNLIPIMVKAIQDLKGEHDLLNTRVAVLENA